MRAVGASGGLAIGHAHVLGREAEPDLTPGIDSEPEAKVDASLDQVVTELQQLAERLRADGHTEEAEIIDVGALMAQDPMLRAEARAAAAKSGNAAAGILAATEKHAAMIDSLDDPNLRERAADVRQIGRRGAGAAGNAERATAVEGDRVIVAHELGPADIIETEPLAIVAAVAVKGGPNSHAAIIARSLARPLVLGVSDDILSIPDGTLLIVDGDRGEVVVDPSEEVLSIAREKLEQARLRRVALESERELPCRTLDGEDVGLLINAASLVEVRAGLAAGAEGVGLLRTEIPFLESDRWPTQQQHLSHLKPILAELTDAPATVRVLDFGGDKIPPFLKELEPESNEGLPARGLPALLRTPGVLDAQLRAILEAGRETRLRILLPMVTSLKELAEARAIFDRAVKEAEVDAPEFGVMIEVPSAALLADRFATSVDFMSIGTNDLTQHVLGLNRRDPSSEPALAAHPSVLRLIRRVVRVGEEHGCAVRVCGEGAADPTVLPLLIGAGVRSVSVSPARIDETRARVRRLRASDCVEVLGKALEMGSMGEVKALVARSVLTDL